jgi:hypothetical protein
LKTAAASEFNATDAVVAHFHVKMSVELLNDYPCARSARVLVRVRERFADGEVRGGF